MSASERDDRVLNATARPDLPKKADSTYFPLRVFLVTSEIICVPSTCHPTLRFPTKQLGVLISGVVLLRYVAYVGSSRRFPPRSNTSRLCDHWTQPRAVSQSRRQMSSKYCRACGGLMGRHPNGTHTPCAYAPPWELKD